MVIPGLIPAVVEGCSLLYRSVAGHSSSDGISDCCRSCVIEIRNQNKALEFRRPEYHLYSGVCQIPPEPVIAPGDKANCVFRKVYNSTFGTAGVITYNIHKIRAEPCKETTTEAAEATVEEPQRGESSDATPDETSKLVLMWSVPFFGTTYHAVGIEQNPMADEDLYQKLYYGDEKWFRREVSGIGVKYEGTAHGCPVSVFGSISNAGQATWTIDIE